MFGVYVFYKVLGLFGFGVDGFVRILGLRG